MSIALHVLTHPAVPIAWWAVNTPGATDMLAGALGLGPSRRRLEMDDDDKVWGGEYQTLMIIAMCVSILVPIAAYIIYGTSYKGKVTDARPPLPNPVPPEYSLADKDFRYGIFACKDDCQYCLHGWLVSSVRTSDSYQATGSGTFWAVMVAFLATWAIAQAVSVGLQLAMVKLMETIDMPKIQTNAAGNIGWFVADIWLAWYLASCRRGLRARFGDADPGKKFWKDMVLWWWCACCVAIQDARQVDGASGVRVECCCSLRKEAAQVNVGKAVVIGEVGA